MIDQPKAPGGTSGPPRGEGELGYLPIRLSLVLPLQTSPCDLFRLLGGGEFVLVAGRGLPVGETLVSRLNGLGVDQLFIRAEEASGFFGALREALTGLVRNPGIPAREKAQAVHAACQEALRRVFIDPRAPFITQAREILTPAVDLILDDEEATRYLIRLTAYDHATYVHSTNVGIFSLALGRIFLGNPAFAGLRRAGVGFFLHDLGKCRVPLEILNKPGELTAAERKVINLHPEDGWRMVVESDLLPEEAAIIVLQHHERDDGSGYPFGLKGDAIHPFARICRLADVYEALTSERPYHQRHSTFEALKMMRDRVMVDTDPDLLRNFIGLFAS